MIRYIAKRLGYLVLVLVGVSFIVFTLLQISPGDPVRMMLGESATPEAKAELREELGLDDPFLVQYGNYLKKIVFEQDLGISYNTGRPVVNHDRLPQHGQAGDRCDHHRCCCRYDSRYRLRSKAVFDY